MRQYVLAAGLTAALGAAPAPAAAAQNETPVTATRPAVSAGAPSTAATPPAAGAQEIADHFELIVGDNTAQARRLGATKLLDIGTDDAVTRLADILRNNASARLPARLAVCEAIAGSERPPVLLLEALASCLGDKSPGMGEAMTRALRRFDSALVVERLRPLAKDGEVPLERRLAAIAALGETGDDIRAVAALATLLEGTTPTVQAAALTAFSNATGVRHESATAALAWWGRHATLTGTQWLWRVNEARREQVRQLQATKADLNRRVVALSRDAYLATAEADRDDKLLAFLRDDLASVRSLGLDLINDLITDRKDVDADTKQRMVELIADADATVRLKAARIASELRLNGSLARLLDALAVEVVPDVRAAQVAALGRLDDASAVPALIARLSDDALAVVGETAAALGQLARRRPEAGIDVEPVVAAILERYGRLRATDEDVREKFIQAMARIGDESFRLELRRASAPVESIRIRRAAIAGLGSFADAQAADDLRGMLSAREPEIRQSAAEALGKCGRRTDDLATLMPHLYARSESEPAVREQAWLAYLAIGDRLPTGEVIRLSKSFDRPGDKIDQQRRVELLRSLRVNESRFEGLSAEQRFDLLVQLAAAQGQVGDNAGAASSLEQAAALRRPADPADALQLMARALASRLAAREDAAAVQKVMQSLESDDADAERRSASLRAFADVVLAEARKRAEQAADAPDFVSATALLDSAAEMIDKSGRAPQADAARALAAGRRTEAVDRLLASYQRDGEGESKLLGFGAAVVAPRVAALLAGATDNAADPAMGQALPPEAERRLIELARKLLPEWKGYDAAADAEQRAAAIESLRRLAATTTPPNGRNGRL